MLRTSLVLAFLLALPAVSSAQVEEDPVALFYRAFYQETALRDFEAAKALYEGLTAAEAERGDSPLLARALLGRARCAQALGQREEAKMLFGRALALDPENEEARRGAEAVDVPSAADDLQAHIQTSIQRLASAERQQAIEELLVYGTRAVPALADGLRSPKAGVVDLCSAVLVMLAGREDEAALEEYGRALEDPAVLLRAPLVENLGNMRGSVRDTLRTWGRVADIPEASLRRQAFSHLFREIEQNHNNGITQDLSDHDDPVLGLLQHVRDREPTDVQAHLLRVSYAFLENSSPEQLAVLQELVGRGLFGGDEVLRDASRALFKNYVPFYEAHRQDFLREVLERGDALSEDDVTWVFNVIRRKHVPGEDLAALLESVHEPVRTRAFWILNGRRLTDPATWPHQASAFVTQNVIDWVEGRVTDSPGNRVDFRSSFNGHHFDPDELVAIWKAYERQKWGARGTTAQRARSSRDHLLTLLLADLPEGERVARLRGVYETTPEADVRASLLKDLAMLEPVPPIFEVCRAAAADPDPDVRSSAYLVLGQLHESHPERVETIEAPHLGRDVVDGIAYSLTLFVFGKQRTHAGTLRADLDHAANGDWAPILAALIAVEGVEACQADILSRFGMDASGLSPDQQPAWFSSVCYNLGRFIDRSDPRWLELAELLGSEPALLAKLVFEVGFRYLTPEEGGRLLRLALADAAGIDRNDLERLLHSVNGSLDVPIEVVLPYLRHRSDEVRQAATKAFDTIRRYETYRNAAVSFGSDARAKAITAIQRNARDADPLRRRAAAHGIAALGDPDGIALLFDLLGDTDEGVRQAAVAALERMGSRVTAAEPPAETEKEEGDK